MAPAAPAAPAIGDWQFDRSRNSLAVLNLVPGVHECRNAERSSSIVNPQTSMIRNRKACTSTRNKACPTRHFLYCRFSLDVSYDTGLASLHHLPGFMSTLPKLAPEKLKRHILSHGLRRRMVSLVI